MSVRTAGLPALTPVPVVLCGFWPHATAEAAKVLLARHPALRQVPFASSAPAGADLLVTLPEAYEPDQVRAAWPARTADGAVHVITVVPADLLLDGLTDETELRAVDRHLTETDERSVGDLVSRQIEQADTVLLAGQPEGDDPWEAEQLRVLLRRIAPWAQHRDLADVVRPAGGRREPFAALTRGLHGHPIGVHEPLAEHDVVACVFRARRPFHPGRLHDALDDITEQVLRSRGYFWLASRPELVLTWESAATLRLGPVSGWLADLPGEHWAAVDPERCLAAEIDWDPYYDDRHQHLAFVGIDLDPVRLHRTLAGCLLTDAELADGPDGWRLLADPFRRACPPAALHTTPRRPAPATEENQP